MAVIHPDSVISKDIKEFNTDFYKSLVEKENYCYTSTRTHASVDNYQPFFTDLNNAIMAYLNKSRDITKWRGLTNTLYVYDYLKDIMGDNLISESDIVATYIANIDDYIPLLLTKANDYFDDIIQQSETDPETGQTTTYYEAPTLEDDTARIQSEADTLSTENGKIETVQNTISPAVDSAIQEAAYTTYERDFSGQSKEGKYKYVFEELKYKQMANKLNGLQDLDPLN